MPYRSLFPAESNLFTYATKYARMHPYSRLIKSSSAFGFLFSYVQAKQ